MEHAHAVDLLRKGVCAAARPQQWADLGCGTGTFTMALADLLPAGSLIHAMDRDRSALAQVPSSFGGTRMIKFEGDFVRDPLPASELDGILLANALHFAKDQPAFIRKAAACLKPGGRFLLVEYDTDTPNSWVPYPLSRTRAVDLFQGARFDHVAPLGERPSAFGGARLYSLMVSRR